ncbi:MAG TPA: hypothetical protein VN456_01115 [Desulfosporosinus sp.]|nr:hypothetical protein [Desulfosporosinus sp.]
MPLLTRRCNPAFPEVFPPGYPPHPPQDCLDPKAPETYDYGFRRLVPLLHSPPVGAGIIAITFFFFIVFFSNVLLDQVSSTTLGITVTLGTFGVLALLILILFIV